MIYKIVKEKYFLRNNVGYVVDFTLFEKKCSENMKTGNPIGAPFTVEDNDGKFICQAFYTPNFKEVEDLAKDIVDKSNNRVGESILEKGFKEIMGNKVKFVTMQPDVRRRGRPKRIQE